MGPPRHASANASAPARAASLLSFSPFTCIIMCRHECSHLYANDARPLARREKHRWSRSCERERRLRSVSWYKNCGSSPQSRYEHLLPAGRCVTCLSRGREPVRRREPCPFHSSGGSHKRWTPQPAALSRQLRHASVIKRGSLLSYRVSNLHRSGKRGHRRWAFEQHNTRATTTPLRDRLPSSSQLRSAAVLPPGAAGSRQQAGG